MEIFLIVLTLTLGFYMLWNMGANDVANAVGTSVGSGAITLKTAILIAAILEFTGAFTLGSNVSETIQNGIINPLAFQDEPTLFIFGMLAALLSTALWVQIATFFRWPVSTTHAIVGAVLGFGLIVAPYSAIKWPVIGTIVISWIISPSLSAFIAFIIFSFIQKKILFTYSPLLATKKIAPILVFITLLIFIISTLANGIRRFEISLVLVIAVATIIGIIGGIICHFACKKIHLNTEINHHITPRQQQQIHNLNKVQKYLMHVKLATSGEMKEEIANIINSVSTVINNARDKTKWDSHISADFHGVEKIFGGMQIITACFVAFAHGANDVANAVGPMSGIFHIIQNSKITSASVDIPPWLLAFGGIGIVIGLATYGWRVIETIGKKITQLTPTRGFSAEFAAATTILIASKMGLPISTTHAIVGAVLGVGIARGISSINFKLVRDIFLSWIITIPSALILSMIIFYIFKLIFM